MIFRYPEQGIAVRFPVNISSCSSRYMRAMKKVFFILLLLSFTASAEVFKCSVEGKVIYSEFPCEAGALPLKPGYVSAIETPANTATIVRGADGVYSASGSVDGQTALFIVDTGASVTTLSGDLAYRLGVRSCSADGSNHTANGDAGYCKATISSLSFAGFNYSNVSVHIMPGMRGNSVIGNDLISGLKVTQHNGVMVLSR
jgi:aspartyl protease family protein